MLKFCYCPLSVLLDLAAVFRLSGNLEAQYWTGAPPVWELARLGCLSLFDHCDLSIQTVALFPHIFPI